MNKAIIVAVSTNNNKYDLDYSLDELTNLATSCNIEVCDRVSQNLDRPTSNFYVGSGKILEIKNLCEVHEADLVIFNDELSPSQLFNIEKELDTNIIDRTLLILDIFASRAKTKEAMMQVELSQLKYLKPRLGVISKNSERQQGGVGSKGPGEKKIELNRRKIEKEISVLSKNIEEVKKYRNIQRQKRSQSNIPVISLVGYTNSGKSTLMNKILEICDVQEDKKVFEKDMLFATLDTYSRVCKYNNKKFILVDTVGFVSQLPHHLVESFKSTLEEVVLSNLLFHVVDYSNVDFKSHIQVTENVIGSLYGSNTIETKEFLVYNKIDKLTDFEKAGEKDLFYISAKSNIGIDELLENALSYLYKDEILVNLVLPYEEGKVYSKLKENYEILSEDYINEGINVSVKIDSLMASRLNKFIKKEDV